MVRTEEEIRSIRVKIIELQNQGKTLNSPQEIMCIIDTLKWVLGEISGEELVG